MSIYPGGLTIWNGQGKHKRLYQKSHFLFENELREGLKRKPQDAETKRLPWTMFLPARKSFSIRLGFQYLDSDSASVAWYKLKANFEKDNPFTLEHQLFYKMTHIMEVPPTNAKVRVSDNWDLNI